MNHALFSRASYSLNLTGKNKQKRLAKADAQIPDGYKTHEASNRDVQLYVNDDDKRAVISHRGTDLGKRRDLTADMMFALGLEKHSDAFNKREAHTRKLANKIPADYKLDMTGHSYGGASAVYALEKSPKMRDRVSEVHLYNPLTSPIPSKIHVHKGKSKNVAVEKLHNMITTHRVAGDVVSMPGTYGETIEHTSNRKFKPTVLPDALKPAIQTLDQMATHSIRNFI